METFVVLKEWREGEKKPVRFSRLVLHTLPPPAFGGKQKEDQITCNCRYPTSYGKYGKVLKFKNYVKRTSRENVGFRRRNNLPSPSAFSSNSSSIGLLSAGDGGRPLDLTPSPSDSGVVELEVALKERDSELAYLRQTMEHNEQVIVRVYQEKERLWERELRRMKNVHDNRLRAAAQKALKLEQMLMMQTYQVCSVSVVASFDLSENGMQAVKQT